MSAEFNRNVLRRLNREAGAGFDVESFEHEARWNAELARIEMHLVSQTDQDVPVGMETVAFARGESIYTENSHKYTRAALEKMAGRSGWRLVDFLMYDAEFFAVAVLVPNGDGSHS